MQLTVIHISLFTLLLHCTVTQLNKVTLTDPAALCLDGSSATYYIGKGRNPRSVVIYFEGGGWCGDRDLSSTVENCYQRSRGYMGSSKSDPNVLNPADGIYSSNPNNNYRESTRIFIRYCDGSGHQGSRQNPVSYKGANLYFRGHNITVAQLQDANKRQSIFTQAQEIIVTGGSAGGLAAFLWADYVRGKAKNAKVVCAPDSGVFLDSAVFQTNVHLYSMQFENLFKLSNAQIDPPVQDCAKVYKDTSYKCMMAQYMAQYIKTPLFPIQSLYDSWSIPNILNITCLKGNSLENCNKEQSAYIDQYFQNTTLLMKDIAKRQGNGAWGVACATHGFVHDGRFYSDSYRVPYKSSNTIEVTLVNWINNTVGNNTYIDNTPWPGNVPCSGVALTHHHPSLIV